MGAPSLEILEGQVGWSFEKSGLVDDNSVHGNSLETDDL